jgi:DNA-binding response OmpR family regulator
LPVIYISGYTPETTRLREGLKAGEEFLAKPFSIEALRQAVNGALKRKENPWRSGVCSSEIPA